MKYKLYRAIDKTDGKDSCFLVRQLDNCVAVSYWSENRMEYLCKENCRHYDYSNPRRIKDALNPVFILEFEV